MTDKPGPNRPSDSRRRYPLRFDTPSHRLALEAAAKRHSLSLNDMLNRLIEDHCPTPELKLIAKHRALLRQYDSKLKAKATRKKSTPKAA